MFKLFVPFMSTFPLPLDAAMRCIKDAGFDGTQVLLTKRQHLHQDFIMQAAHRTNLAWDWHEIWSRQDQVSNAFHNKVLHVLGVIPTYISERRYLIEDVTKREIVCYPDPDTITLALHRTNLLFQTVGSMAWRRHGYDWDTFVRAVKVHNFKVVLDTQHGLMFANNFDERVDENKRAFAREYDSVERLVTLFGKIWMQLHPHVVQIHFNDFDWRGRHLRDKVWPGSGMLGDEGMRRIAGVVRESGWDGVVVPEVKQLVVHRLPELSAKVRDLFGWAV